MNLQLLQKRIQAATVVLHPCSQKLDALLLRAIQGNMQPNAYRLELLREIAQSCEHLQRLMRRVSSVYEYELDLLSVYEKQTSPNLKRDMTDADQIRPSDTLAP